MVGSGSALDRGNPSAARIYDLLLADGDLHSADLGEALRILCIAPEFRQTCIANRRFMERAVRHLAGQGITQFLDVGTGLPMSPNVHEVARRANPEARVVYVDNDPLVVSRGRALLTTGGTAMIEADLRDPAAIMEHKDLRRVLDLDQPIAVLMLFAVNHIADEEDPARVVAGFMGPAATGSHLVLSHPTHDIDYGRCSTASGGGAMGFCRSYLQIYRFFSGLRLLEPGLIRSSLWRPDGTDIPRLGSVWAYGGVARK